LAIALSTAVQLSSARHQLRGWALGLGVDPDIAHDISAGTYEALSNAIEHAYPDQHGPVTLTAHHHPGAGSGHRGGTEGGGEEIMVVVSDEGSWRAPPSDASWRGRGLRLITALGGQLDIRVGEHGTTTTIRWALN
jgi:anti-sigma regulatory factor (Ser/Thr protein kinase)